MIGGAGIPNWAAITCARQVEFFLKGIDKKTFCGHALRTSLKTSQLEYGHGQSLLAMMDVRMEGMTPTRITNLHKLCAEFVITIPGGWCAPLQRTNDLHIATVFTSHFPNSTTRELRLFRDCFRHMNVTTLADITNAAGTHLARGARELRVPAYPSIFHFHLQPIKITTEHRAIWNRCLDAITTSNRQQLYTPLGAWTSTPSTIRPFRLAGGSLYKQHDNKQWYWHQLCDSQQIQRTPYRRYSSATYHQQDLPSPNIIVDVEIRGGG